VAARKKKTNPFAAFKARRNELVLAGIAIVVSLAVGEIAVRAFRPYVRGSHQHPSQMGRDDILANDRLGQHHPTIGWVLRPNTTTINRSWEFEHTITTNSKGLRDDETSYERQPGVRRILILGDSFAMGDGVDRGLIFADVMEELLPATEVVNTSVSGYGTDQELLAFLDEGHKYKADVVLLVVTIANDLENNAGQEQYAHSKPYYVLDDGELELRGTPVPEKFRKSVTVPNSQLRTTFPVHDFLDANSALYAATFEALARIPWLRQQWEERKLLYSQESVYYAWQVGVLRAQPKPEQESAWQLTLALINKWKNEVDAAGATPVLVLIPSHLQVYPQIWSRAVDQFDLVADRFDLEYPNLRLVEFAGSIGLRSIDLLPGFRTAAESGKKLYYRRNPHWNREGHNLAAEIIARELPDF